MSDPQTRPSSRLGAIPSSGSAIDLLLPTGRGRTPAMIVYAKDLARRLGITGQHATHQLALLDPTIRSRGADTAASALHEELARLDRN